MVNQPGGEAAGADGSFQLPNRAIRYVVRLQGEGFRIMSEDDVATKLAAQRTSAPRV